MKQISLRLRFESLIFLCIFSLILIGDEYIHLSVEDFYGEWQLDRVQYSGGGTMFTEETIVERFDYHIAIGKTSFFNDDDDLHLYEDIQWQIDTLCHDGSDCTYFTLHSNDLISSDVPTIELTALLFGKTGQRTFDISLPGFLAYYYDSWFVFYKKVETERHTDFANPLMNNILGEWEPYEFCYRYDYFMTHDQYNSAYSKNIKFDKDTYTDHNGKVHDAIYEIHPLPSDAPSICTKHYPDSVRASFGVISKFVIFSKEGFVWDKFEVTGTGIMADITTNGMIMYRKLPSQPLKKQGAQP